MEGVVMKKIISMLCVIIFLGGGAAILLPNAEALDASDIRREKSDYSQEYLNASFDVLMACKKTCQGSQLEGANNWAEADNKLTTLKFKFPKQKYSVLTKMFSTTLDALYKYKTNLEYTDSLPWLERENEDLGNTIRINIEEIEKGLGL